MAPLVSVVTSTWQRHHLLRDRCIPSVRAQDYPLVEHVVVSDGPDPELAGLLDGAGVIYTELPVHDAERHWGAAARRLGIEHATGDLITYCDDDDALRPGHCSLLAGALDADPGDFPYPMFAVSRMVSHQPSGEVIIGHGPVQYGLLGTPMIMHRRGLLKVATWGAPSACEDWDLVAAWLAAGTAYARVDADTVDVWPSAFGSGQ